jgi:hypothetical protein
MSGVEAVVMAGGTRLLDLGTGGQAHGAHGQSTLPEPYLGVAQEKW